MVNTVITVGGTIDTFNATNFRRGMASFLVDVNEEDITLTVTAASVQVSMQVVTPSQGVAGAVTERMEAANVEATLSAATGAQVLSMETPTAVVEEYIPPPFEAFDIPVLPADESRKYGLICSTTAAVGIVLAAFVGARPLYLLST